MVVLVRVCVLCIRGMRRIFCLVVGTKFVNKGAYSNVCDRSEQILQQPNKQNRQADGAIAQLGERLLCTQEVGGSIPPGSTKLCIDKDQSVLIVFSRE